MGDLHYRSGRLKGPLTAYILSTFRWGFCGSVPFRTVLDAFGCNLGRDDQFWLLRTRASGRSGPEFHKKYRKCIKIFAKSRKTGFPDLAKIWDLRKYAQMRSNGWAWYRGTRAHLTVLARFAHLRVTRVTGELPESYKMALCIFESYTSYRFIERR